MDEIPLSYSGVTITMLRLPLSMGSTLNIVELDFVDVIVQELMEWERANEESIS